VRRFLDYYRQFEELPPDELSRQLRDQADERRRRALAEVEPLDLSTTTWHEPPHPETINAATFALRRALNAAPDPEARALREALAARHEVEPAQVVLGNGAGELLQSACHVLLGGGGELLVGWPGWHPLPRLAERAGGRPVPAPLDLDALAAAVGPATRAIGLCSPGDPTGAVLSSDDLRAFLARVPERVTVLLDEALAEFRPPGSGAVALLADAPHLLIVRSFSKAHALAGLRAGYALASPGAGGRWDALAPALGISAPAQAAALWAAESGDAVVARRRAAAERDRERLAAALAGSPVGLEPGSAPFVWLSADGLDARELAARLAAAKVFVAPGAAWGDERHVRAALRGPQAVDRLAEALLAAVSEL
jgi:histidinol-phosphate/aromatic aminotransferase/cobyric acid decarboxylase-like protein